MTHQKRSIDLSGLKTNKSLRAICVNLSFLFCLGVLAFFISGGIIYTMDHRAELVYTSSSCQVESTRYDQRTCVAGRGGRYVCYIPVWRVTYTLKQNATENRTNATIEQRDGYRTIAAAESKLNEYKIGMSYSCWRNIISPSIARWDKPNALVGRILLIFGGVFVVLCFVGSFYSYRFHTRMKMEN